MQNVKSNDILTKSEINEKKEKYEETKEEENIEEIKKVKRKSALYLNKNKKKIKEKIKAEEEFNIKEEIQNIVKKDSEHYSTEVNNIKEEENIYKNIKKEKKNIYSTKKGLFKKNLQIETEEDNIELTESNDKNTKNLLSESELNNKKKPLLQSESNISDIFSSERILPLKIKIFKCIIYRNTEPTLNEEKIREIFHKKNKSLGIEKSLIIKLPEDINEAIDKKEKGIDSFDRYLEENGLKEGLLSTDTDKNSDAFLDLVYRLFDSGHDDVQLEHSVFNSATYTNTVRVAEAYGGIKPTLKALQSLTYKLADMGVDFLAGETGTYEQYQIACRQLNLDSILLTYIFRDDSQKPCKIYLEQAKDYMRWRGTPEENFEPERMPGSERGKELGNLIEKIMHIKSLKPDNFGTSRVDIIGNTAFIYFEGFSECGAESSFSG